MYYGNATPQKCAVSGTDLENLEEKLQIAKSWSHKTEPASRTPSLSVLSPRAECLQILALWQNPDKGWLLEQNPDKYWLSGQNPDKRWLSGQNPDKYWLPGQNPDKHWLPEMALWVEYALESEFRCRLILQAESWLSKSKTCHTLLSKKSIHLSNPSNPWVS